MGALPALTKTYSARANCPLLGTATQLEIARSTLLALKRHLTNTQSTGTQTNTRDPNSVWTVRGSGNGVTSGLDAVDRWSSLTDVVAAAPGTAHSWIVLENLTLGYQLCLAANSASPSGCVAFAKNNVPFSGGSNTARPLAGAEDFVLGSATLTSATGTTTPLTVETTLGLTMYSHFSCATDGQFTFFVSRAGSNQYGLFCDLRKTVDVDVADTRNLFGCLIASAATRGAPGYTALTSAGTGYQGRSVSGAAINAVLSASGTFGGVVVVGDPSRVLDTRTSKPLAFAMRMVSTNEFSNRGTLPDVAFVTAVAVNSDATLADRLVVGDMLIPFPGTKPLI
jgi:hypothetical protein